MPEQSIRQHPPSIRVYLLGPLRIVVDGRELPRSELPRNKPLLVLQCLLTQPRHQISNVKLGELLFEDSSLDDPGGTIRPHLTNIRNPLGWGRGTGFTDLLLHRHGMTSIVPEAGLWVDADEFERLVDRAKRAEDPYPLLEEANSLYAGEYLPAVRDADWAEDRRRHLEGLWSQLQLQLAQHRERRGDASGAAAALEAVLRAEPCDEDVARELMLLYARSGRRMDALQIYPRLVRALKDELDVEPSRETTTVWQQISAGTTPAATPSSPPPTPAVQRATGLPGVVPTGGGRADDRLDPARFVPAYPFPMPERLIGRENALTFLEKIVQRGRTVQQDQRHAQIALVSAPAGTGKSALLGALVQRARRAGFLCLVGGGYEDEGAAPLGPVHDAFADYLFWQSAERVRAELDSGLEDLTLLVPELRPHLGLPPRSAVDPSVDRARLFACIHAYLRGLAERSPVLLCLEDLHAADGATLALIEHLARLMGRQRLVIVGTFRTEELRPGRPLSDLVTALRRRNAEQLDLQPLTRPLTARMIAALLEGQPSQRLAEALFSTTEGNPLFVEQLVLALREEGKIDQQDGIWRQIGDLSDLPTIVRDVVGQRLDRLSDSARRTLEIASVLGQSFEYGGLLAASEHGDDEMRLLQDLDEVFGARILHKTSTECTFSHPLIREVAYAGLSPFRQMQLHARAGEALERRAGPRADDRAAELAHHFLAGGESTPTRQKALRYSLIAGRRAAALSAYREALDHFTHACELSESADVVHDTALRLEALSGRGLAARSIGAWGECANTFRAFLAICHDPARRAHARDSLARALTQEGHTADALAECETGLAELVRIPDDAGIAGVRLRLQYSLALLLFLGGRYRKLLALAEEVLPAAERLAQPGFLSMARVIVAWSHMAQGRVELALEQYDHALEEAYRGGNKIQVAVAHVNRGVQKYRGARFADARPDLEQSIAIFRDVANDGRAINGIQTLSRVWLAEGDLERATEQAELAQMIAAETDDRWAAECHDLFGTIQAARCQWELAEASFYEAIEVRTRVGHMAGLAESLVGLGLVYERSGDWPRAREAYCRAVDVTRAMDECPQGVSALWHIGRLMLRSGNAGTGAAYIEEAHALAETMAESLAYAPAVLALAELRLADCPEASAKLAEQALARGLTAEMRVEGYALATSAYLALQQEPVARTHAAHAIELAEWLGTPHPLGLAFLARGRLEAAAGDLAASATLEIALQHFVTAGAPYGQGLALQQAANVLEMLHHDGERAATLRLDAARLLPTRG